jgi:hypothetical protein
MGRTVAPFSFVLDDYVADLRPWRKNMGDADRKAFDLIFKAAHYHMPASVMASAVNPGDSILLASVLEPRKAVSELEVRVQELKRRLTAVVKGRRDGQ